ncbi:hypothetical protein LIER_08505 [Lithospermum erythrorhizon]|uniref:TIR domain-containing protein n=1 Tax=Lithospermum erythrorhizon TaxID=34254 RepID=A0AAV3PF06_LITER
MAEDDKEMPSFRYFWDIFLSFRGEDTRNGFTAKLYKELSNKGVRTFLDDKGLERGAVIAPTLVAAIKDSAAAVAVISENYASSKWCLEELATILLDCKKLLFPVFYEVDPSDVRRQKGSFENGFRELEEKEKVGSEKITRWRQAMNTAGAIAGWASKNKEESYIIKSVVEKILSKLSNTPLGVAKYPVGLGPRLIELQKKLDLKDNGVRIVVLWGMGGIGKTTLANAIYNELVRHFKKRSFLSNIREASQQSHGVRSLQGKLIGDLNSGSPLTNIHDTRRGILLIKERIHDEPVLLVLDDVDDAQVVYNLAGGRDWFFNGSRIIITTRDKNVLPRTFVDEILHIEELSSSESLQLFSYHAFGRDEPIKDFLDLSKQVVSLTGGLPLALEVFGASLFHRRTMRQWHAALEKLKQIRPRELQDILEISFNSLDDQEKCIFLDLACFFVHRNLKREDAIDIFKGCGFIAETAITDLTAKSLVKVIENDVLWMHDQLREMGRQIVRSENDDAGRRSRLWKNDEAMMVLKKEMGTSSIQGITLEFDNRQLDFESAESTLANSRQRNYLTSGISLVKKICGIFVTRDQETGNRIVHTKSLQPLVHLRVLQINHVNLTGNFKLIPANLKWLQWRGCPLQVIPSNFIPGDLAVLDLSNSKILQLWDSYGKIAKKLRVVNLCDCYYLTEIPDLSGLQLEKLILKNCKSLVKIHKSIGDMNKLVYLNLQDCESLVKFADDVSGLKCLRKLVLSGCSNLAELPEDMSGLGSLRELFVDNTKLHLLPNSIFRLKSLEVFNLDGCQFLKSLPISIGNLSSLRDLSLNHSGLEEITDSIEKLTGLERLGLMCRSLKSIPSSIGSLSSLSTLYLNNSLIEKLPESIGSLSNLRHLSVGGCRSLKQLPSAISGFSSLVTLNLENSSLENVPHELGLLSSLKELNMRSCEFLRSLPDLFLNMISLTTLDLANLPITELPGSIGDLERLVELKLSNCSNIERLPKSIGRLRSLCYLSMEETSITEIPKEFGTLSSLKLLKMGKKKTSRQLPNADILTGELESKPTVIPESFSNLVLLEHLEAQSWNISGKIPDGFEKLTSLQILRLDRNNFYSLPSSLKGLSALKHLQLPNCKELKLIPPLPSTLTILKLANCTALTSLSDLSNLESLQELDITNCKKITDVPGLEHLKSLIRLYTGGCNACIPSIKRRLSKVALKNIRYVCVPGSRIPSWFIQEVPRYSIRKNLELKSVIIGLVVSLDQDVQDDFRTKVPAIIDIQAKIIRQGDPRYTTVLYLLGVPDTSEDQLYFCRFHDYNRLLLMLEDGDEIRVSKLEIPRFKGLNLKQCGLHMVFENEDDYDDNDDALFDEPQQSVSRRLANFFKSM